MLFGKVILNKRKKHNEIIEILIVSLCFLLLTEFLWVYNNTSVFFKMKEWGLSLFRD